MKLPLSVGRKAEAFEIRQRKEDMDVHLSAELEQPTLVRRIRERLASASGI